MLLKVVNLFETKLKITSAIMHKPKATTNLLSFVYKIIKMNLTLVWLDIYLYF